MNDAAYGPNTQVAERTADSHVRDIRAKFLAAGCLSIIATVHSVNSSWRRILPERLRPNPSKWRPPSALVVVSVLLTVMAPPAAIIVWAGRVDLARGMTSSKILVLAATLLLTLAVGYVLTRALTRPIQQMAMTPAERRRFLDSIHTEPDRLNRPLLRLRGRINKAQSDLRLQTWTAREAHALEQPYQAAE